MAYWIWLVLGLGLIAIEMATTTFVLIWFGISAVIIGIVAGLVPGLDHWVQLFAFGVLALVLLGPAWAVRARLRQHAHSVRPELINDRAAQHIGRRFVLSEPITHGQGRAFLGDTLWRLQGPDLAAGRAVRITGADGMTLKVEAAEGA